MEIKIARIFLSCRVCFVFQDNCHPSHDSRRTWLSKKTRMLQNWYCRICTMVATEEKRTRMIRY